MTPHPSKSDELQETVIHSFDGVVKGKDGGEAESLSASDASSISAPIEKKPQNNSWIWISALLVLSTLFQSVKPSEPYIPDFWRDIKFISSAEVLSGPPYRTYAMAIMLPIVSYSSEYFLGYVPAIIFGLLCRWLCQFTYYYGPSVLWYNASFAIFGLSHSTKTIYSAFTYTMVPVHAFHRITAYIRSANFIAHVLGGSLGNLIIEHAEPHLERPQKEFSFFLMFTLSQVCVGLGVMAFMAAIVLNYFYQVGSKDALANIKPPAPKSLHEAKQLFQRIYYCPEVRIWSLWFIFSFAAIDAVWDYQSMLFKEHETSGDFKGFVTAGTRLGCAAAAILAGRSKNLYAKWNIAIITLSGSIVAVCLGLNVLVFSIYQVYALFFITMVVNEFCICGITAQIAVKTQQSLRGIILLVNMIIAMVFQSILQFSFNSLKFNVHYKYLGLSVCMFVFTGGMLAFLFGHACVEYVKKLLNGRQQPNNVVARI